MNVELIKVDPATAKAKLLAYRRGIAARAHSKAAERVRKEYEQIEAGYEAAAKGFALIELTKAMATGGWDEQGRPKFAVARADKRRVECRVPDRRWADELRFEDPRSREASSIFRFKMTVLPPRPAAFTASARLSAIVPMVPPDVLKRPDADLSRRVILWEADWQQAPVDPLLLLPIGGDLYAVEAAWDLTPLERAVIAGRQP